MFVIFTVNVKLLPALKNRFCSNILLYDFFIEAFEDPIQQFAGVGRLKSNNKNSDSSYNFNCDDFDKLLLQWLYTFRFIKYSKI